MNVSMSASSAPDHVRRAPAGEELTRRAITVITGAIVAMALAFSVVNVTRLSLDLGVTGWIAWLIGPSVDLSVIGLLAKMHRFLRFCGLLTLGLNTAGSLWHLQFGTAAVDAIGPMLLIGWSEIGPWLLREINAVCSSAAQEQTAAERPQASPAAPARPVELPAGLLALTRDLDAEHRAATGRPISRDSLRDRLKIGRDRAGDLVAAVRAEAASGARPLPVQQAA
jgi:hypothetical protein